MCVYFVIDVRVIGISEKSIYSACVPNTSTGSNQFHTRNFNPCRFVIQKWDANKCALGIQDQESWKAADREGCPTDFSSGSNKLCRRCHTKAHFIDTSLPVEFCKALWCSVGWKCLVFMLWVSQFKAAACHFIDVIIGQSYARFSLSNYAIMTSKFLSCPGQETWGYMLLPDQSSLAVFYDVRDVIKKA